VPFVVEGDVRLVVVEQVEHHPVAPRHLEVALVQLPEVGVDRLRLGHAFDVLGPRRLQLLGVPGRDRKPTGAPKSNI
jgi:hypothetical protein